jgi:hypothetical protein
MLTPAQVWDNPRKVPCIAVDVVRWQEFIARSRRSAGRAGEDRGRGQLKSKTVSPGVCQASGGEAATAEWRRRVREMIAMQMGKSDHSASHVAEATALARAGAA